MRDRTTHAGGVIHTYQKYDPRNFPSPTQPPPDLVSGAMQAPAVLRPPPRVDPGGTGPGRAYRSQPDRRTRSQSRRAAGDAPATQTEDPRDVRDRPRAGRGRPPLSRTREQRSGHPASSAERFQQALRDEQTLRTRTALVSRRRRTEPACAAIGPAGGTAGRQVPDRRTGRQVRVHRPDAADHPRGPGDQRRTGGHRPAARTTAAGRGDRAGRHH